MYPRRAAAKAAVERMAEHRPATGIDPHPVAAHADVEPTLGAAIGMRAPAGIGKQTGGMAKPLIARPRSASFTFISCVEAEAK